MLLSSGNVVVKTWFIFCLITGSTLWLGCSGSSPDKWTKQRPKTHPVMGRVELDGLPVEAAKVMFQTTTPDTGRVYSAFGYTDSSGRFSLETFTADDGAVAGEHLVTIEKLTFKEAPAPTNEADVVPPPQEISHLPERYRSAASSGLTATVTPDGENFFTFSLE